MDDLTHSFPAPRDDFAELTTGGLILWRLSTSGQSDLWCVVFELRGGFYVVLDDDPEGCTPYKIHEHFDDIVGLMGLAEALKSALLQSGWRDVDIE
jgi:hypothetical protein